ncbi:MAG: hypothetical protein ACK54Y_00280, partial [Bacteroidota bacterium]
QLSSPVNGGKLRHQKNSIHLQPVLSRQAIDKQWNFLINSHYNRFCSQQIDLTFQNKIVSI